MLWSYAPIFAIVVIATGNGSSLDLPNWAQWGILGAGIIAIATGKLIVPAWSLKHEQDQTALERAARLEAEGRERKLREEVTASVHDALKETRDVLNRVTGFLEARRQ